MKIEKRTALIVVDVLKGLTIEGGHNYYPTAKEMMDDNFAGKIAAFKQNGCFVIYICGSGRIMTGYTAAPHAINPELSGRNLGAVPYNPVFNEFDDRLKIESDDIIVRKHTYSAFWGTPLLTILQQNGVENVLVSGIKTNVCCRQTAIDAVSHGYRTFIVSDMTATNTDVIKDYHLEEMNRYFAKVIDSTDVTERLKSGAF